MARPIPFNRTGVVGLETIDASVVNDTLTFYFESHPYVNSPFNGLLLIHFKNTATGITGDMPIFFETRGSTGTRKAVTKPGGDPLIASDIAVPCYSLFFYDFRTGVVEAVAGVVNLT